MESVYNMAYVTIMMRCQHGHTIVQNLSFFAFENTPYAAGDLAYPICQQALMTCQQHQLPVWDSIYSPGQPLTYSPYVAGDLIKSIALQKLYEANWKQEYDSVIVNGNPFTGINTQTILSELMSICPGLASVSRPCPGCNGVPGYDERPVPLAYLIQHVNDVHTWSREKIAEWLDIIALDDPDVDLTIKPKEKHEQPSIGPGSEEIKEFTGIAGIIDSAQFGELVKGILGGSSGD